VSEYEEREARRVADQMQALDAARPYDVSPGTPEDGHLWHFTVSSRCSFGVVGQPGKTDSDWWGEPWSIEVRAWNLPDALRKAAELPLTAWKMPGGEDDGVDWAEVAREDQERNARDAAELGRRADVDRGGDDGD